VPVTTCEKLHRHSRESHASSTTEPVPQLEATLRAAQQCQPSTPVTGQSAAGEGATVDTAKNGPAVMAMADGRKHRSSRLQAHVPSWNSERTLSHGIKTTRPCSIPRMARARTTAAPRTTRPVALTLRQGRRHLWQAKRATLHLRHNDRVKKVRHDVRFRILFHFFFLSLSLHEGNGPRAPLLIRGSKAGPSEGFDSRLRALGLRAHYCSEVRMLAPRKGSTAASGHSGSAPTTDQGFLGWPPKGSTTTSEHAERGMTLGTFDT
jgi:hypothetical protein